MSFRDKTEMECRQNNEMEDSRTQDEQDPPLSSTGDRQTSKPMAFVSPLQRQQPLCCQIDEKALFSFLFVVALVLLLVFCLSFVSEGHIWSNSSTLKWSDAFMGRSAKFSFLFYACLFLCFALGLLTSWYYLWAHRSVFHMCFFSPLSIVIIFYPSCLGRDWSLNRYITFPWMKKM